MLKIAFIGLLALCAIVAAAPEVAACETIECLPVPVPQAPPAEDIRIDEPPTSPCRPNC